MAQVVDRQDPAPSATPPAPPTTPVLQLRSRAQERGAGVRRELHTLLRHLDFEDDSAASREHAQELLAWAGLGCDRSLLDAHPGTVVRVQVVGEPSPEPPPAAPPPAQRPSTGERLQSRLVALGRPLGSARRLALRGGSGAARAVRRTGGAVWARRPAPRSRPLLRSRSLPSLSRMVAPTLVVVGVLLLAEAAVTVVWQEPVSALRASKSQDSLRGDLGRLRAAESAKQSRLRGRLERARHLDAAAVALNRSTATGSVVGRLSIPRINLRFAVVQGSDDASLQKGPGHYQETPLPGTAGHWTVGIAGHRTTYLAPFRHLDKLRPGDRIVLKMPYASFVYAVEGTKIVDAAETRIFVPRRYNRIALTACHPLYSAAQRIIVYGRLKRTKTLATRASRP